MAITKPPTSRPVLVTTDQRGIYFGYAEATDGTTIKLARARCCMYLARDVMGALGLASEGPSGACRISPPADLELRGVASVVEVTPEAVAKWEGGQ